MATRSGRSVVLTQVAPPHPPLAADDAGASPRDPLGSEHYQGVPCVPLISGGPAARVPTDVLRRRAEHASLLAAGVPAGLPRAALAAGLWVSCRDVAG